MKELPLSCCFGQTTVLKQEARMAVRKSASLSSMTCDFSEAAEKKLDTSVEILRVDFNKNGTKWNLVLIPATQVIRL